MLFQLIEIFEGDLVIRIDFEDFSKCLSGFIKLLCLGIGETKSIKGRSVFRFFTKDFFVERDSFRPVFFNSSLDSFFFKKGNIVRVHNWE